MKTIKMISGLAAVVALAVTGCKKEEINDPGMNASGRQFYVNMTDAPANFSRMDITIDRVEAWHDSEGWITLNTATRSYDVLTLSNGNSASLATASNVQTGHYSRLRLHFTDANSVTVHSAVTIGSLFIAAGGTSTLSWGGPSDHYVEIVIDEEVTTSAGAEVMLDFDAANSVREGVNTYVLDPAIREIHNLTTGARGTVTGASGSAFISITDGVNTYSAYANGSGSFLIRGMKPGTYAATIWAPVTNEAGQIEESSQTRSNIVVSEGSYVTISAVHF